MKPIKIDDDDSTFTPIYSFYRIRVPNERRLIARNFRNLRPNRIILTGHRLRIAANVLLNFLQFIYLVQSDPNGSINELQPFATVM